MSDIEAIRKKLARAIDEGRDGDGLVLFARWLRARAEDALEELAARGPSEDLCGPDAAECNGTVEVNGFTCLCPLAGRCKHVELERAFRQQYEAPPLCAKEGDDRG